MNHKNNIEYADDDYESIGTLLKLRMPALVIGLILGIGISFVTSRFVEVLSHNVQVAFFLPFIVYIAAAVGEQTASIYSRDLSSGKAKFTNYLKKEVTLGLVFGLLFGALSGAIAWVWLRNDLLAYSVALSSFIAISAAPLVALLVTQILELVHKDPSASSGPISTVIQDVTSVLIYGTVCSLIIL